MKSAGSNESWVEVKRDVGIYSASTKSVPDSAPVELEAGSTKSKEEKEKGGESAKRREGRDGTGDGEKRDDEHVWNLVVWSCRPYRYFRLGEQDKS